MRSIGRIKTTNDQDKIQSQLIGILCQFMNRVLSFLKYKTALTNTDCIFFKKKKKRERERESKG
jgi:hypothetical protein